MNKMEKINIPISADDIASVLDNNTKYFGSTDYDIYFCPATGAIDCRHNTYNNSEWIKIVDLYNLQYDADDYAEENVGDFLMSDRQFRDNITSAVSDEIQSYLDIDVYLE